QQLIADPEKRPDTAYIAGIDQVAPGEGENSTADKYTRHPVLITEPGYDPSHHFLQEKAAHTRTGINRRQDKYRLKHNGKIIPVRHHFIHEGNPVEYMRHTAGQRYCPAGTSLQFHTNLIHKMLQFHLVQ